MKVICAGFPKTGTKTLYAALSDLGFAVFDFEENFLFYRQEWFQVLSEGSNEDVFKRMYKDVDAVTDLPACYYWKEIHQAFPDAKIILSMRENGDVWWMSMKGQIKVLEENTIYRLMTCCCPTAMSMQFMMNELGRVVFGARPLWPWHLSYLKRTNGALMRKKYESHNADVLMCAPEAKLLVYHCKDGWGPLCKFLGVPVPDKPFPHKNVKGSVVAEKIAEKSKLIKRLQTECTIVMVTVLVMTLYVGCYLCT
ncbi:uncharacterized protein LOC143469006 [Clavelina lepadiformis]|uniref:uncharacterized protein LOC143469006 n=1 Tax=Clavelina lepadiformis TaxID=159417 RepID=UPI00404381F6